MISEGNGKSQDVETHLASFLELGNCIGSPVRSFDPSQLEGTMSTVCFTLTWNSHASILEGTWHLPASACQCNGGRHEGCTLGQFSPARNE